MKIYFNWIWIVGMAIVGYAFYKHFKTANVASPTGDSFSSINNNIAGMTDE